MKLPGTDALPLSRQSLRAGTVESKSRPEAKRASSREVPHSDSCLGLGLGCGAEPLRAQ